MNFLKNLTDADLENSLRVHVDRERKLLHVILEHIVEVNLRELHLARGYESLREYLVKEYGYTGSAADRRVEAAQLLSQVPSVAEKVRDGSINLTQIGQLSSAIKEKERTSGLKISAQDKFELVESIAGLNGRDTQYELAHTLDIPIKIFDKVEVQADESVRVTMTMTKQDYEDLMYCRDLMAQGLVQQRKEVSLGNVVGGLATKHREEIEVQFSERRVAQAIIIQDHDESTSKWTESSTAAVPVRVSRSAVKVNKTLTKKTREIVLARSSCCEFKDHKTGRVCGSKFTPQVDHNRSRKNGGDHSLQNLQTLCARHNRFKYNQERLIEFQFFG